MAITDIKLSGKVFTDAGTAVNGATVALLETGTSTEEASTTTNSSGEWSFTETSLDATYDVKISVGPSSVRYILWSDAITVTGLDAASVKIRGVEGAAAPLYFFADQADDAGDGWRIQASASDTLAIGSDKASAGTIIDYLTITNGANAAASTVTVGGILAVTTTLDVNGTADYDVTDYDIASSGDIDLVSTNDAAAAIYLRENAGTSGTIKIHADQGTSESSIQLLSDAGGVDINAATGKDVDIAGGTVNLTSSDDAASAIYLRANAGTSETIKIHADQGTGTGSISAVSDVGGITLDAGLDIVLSADGGNVTMDDGTSTIFDFNVDDTTLTIHDDQDTGDTAVITMAQHGALSIVTTDDDAAAANIQITADGTAELAGTTVTLNSATDIELDAGGADIFLKDDGTLFGTLTNNSGELLIKSSSSGTTAATFTGANVVFAGTVDATTDFTVGDTEITNGTITDSSGLQLAAAVDLAGNTLSNVGDSGNDWTANQLIMSSALSGNPNQIYLRNTSTDANSKANIFVSVDATDTAGVDPVIDLNINGSVSWTLGVDNSQSDRFTIGSGTSGTNDALRITFPGRAATFDDSTGSDFDYVCASCGQSALEPFACCGVVAWHDDVLALRESRLNPEGMQHMAKLGILEIDGPDDADPGWVGINFQKAQHITWAGMFQNRQRMDTQYEELNKRLQAIGA
jgi:hypothetical protein